MAEMTCRTCHRPFEGRPNRRYCSNRCQRQREEKRRAWNKITASAERIKQRAAGIDDPEKRRILEERAAVFLARRPEGGRPDPA